jgi:hypothetical protein
MTPHHDLYETWKRRRADVPVPEDFADRVLAGLRRPPLFGSRAVYIGVGSLAGVVGLCRVLQVIALFLTGHACM